MEHHKKMKLIAGAAISLVVLVLLVAVVVIIFTHRCELQEKRPICDETKLSRVISKDDRNLLVMSSYLVYWPESDSSDYGRIFMPLKAKSIAASNRETHQYLTISADCARLRMVINISPNDTHSVEVIEVSLKVANGADTECVVTDTSMMVFKSDQHYSCYRRTVYPCKDPEDQHRVIADLVVDRLEFEVNGDPDYISRGRFDTNPLFCENAEENKT